MIGIYIMIAFLLFALLVALKPKRKLNKELVRDGFLKRNKLNSDLKSYRVKGTDSCIVNVTSESREILL